MAETTRGSMESPTGGQTGGVTPVRGLTTPTGTQSLDELNQRRMLVVALNIGTYLLFLYAVSFVFGHGGWNVLSIILMAAFAIGLPWTILGLWNSVIGLWLLHGGKDAINEVAPFATAGDQPTPITIKTAIFMTVRNEDPARAIQRLKTVKASVDATGQGHAFSYFVLSDTNYPQVAAADAP